MESSAILTPRHWSRAKARSTGYVCRDFDSDSVFAALLGGPQDGRWLIAPTAPIVKMSRGYRDETGILETRFETEDGAVKVVDFMALSEEDENQVDLIRMVFGETGRVRLRTEIVLRFDYGRSIPWVRQHFGGLVAVSGPNAVHLITPVELRGTPEMTTVGEFAVEAGETVAFVMSWYPSHHKGFRLRDPYETLLAPRADAVSSIEPL
jgi:GH15 family glucan-1,4-alpha-glucosidase